MALPYTSNNVRAQRLAKLALFRSRQQEAITIPCNLSALRFKIGDNINVTNTRLGYNQKVFEVVGYAMDFSSSGQIVVNVDAIETAASIWDWQASDEEVFLGAGEVELYDGSVAIAPTNISVTSDSFLSDDGTFNSQFNVTWTDADDAFTDHYVVEWKLSSASDYYSQQTKNSPFIVVNLQSSQTYNVRVKAVNELGVSSTYLTATPTAAIDTTAPSLPTSITATAGLKSISLSYTNPAEKDFNNVEIFRSSSSGGTYVEVSNVAGGFGAKAEHLDGGLDDETEYFYKLKSVDLTGNKTSNTDFNAQTAVSATTLAVGAGDVVTTTRITSTSSTAAPTDTVFSNFVGRDPIDGDIVYVTNTSVTPNAQKAYQRISGAWVEQTNLISGDVIEDKSISSDNLSSNSVSPSKIIAHATSLVNPVSASGNVYRYGGYDDAGNIVNAIPSGIAVSFNSSENALSIANAGNSSVRTDSFPIDSNSVYKIKLQIKKTSTGGAWFVGANQYTSFTNGSTQTSNAQTALWFERWDINRNSMQGATNVYFAWKPSVTDTNYDEIVCYFLGSDVDINEVPNHLIPSDLSAGPYIKFNSGSTHGGLRILNWENGSTNRTLIVKNITVQRMTANSIVAQNIDTTNLAAINADLGTITAGSISSALITGDVTEVYPIGQRYYTDLTSSAVVMGSFSLPEPTNGIAKRNKVDLSVQFRVENAGQTGANTGAFIRLEVQKKSKGQSATKVTTSSVKVVVEPESIAYQQIISIAGNQLDKIDLSGGVAASNNASGAYEPASMYALYYDAISDKTFMQISAYQNVFSTGDDLYYNEDKFASAGTWVSPSIAEDFNVHTPEDYGSGTAYQSFYIPFKMSYGQTTTASNYRVTCFVSNAQSNVVYEIRRAVGTLENIS
jgi:hypothetical protein